MPLSFPVGHLPCANGSHSAARQGPDRHQAQLRLRASIVDRDLRGIDRPQDRRRDAGALPIVPLKGKNYVFAQPTLIAETEFRGWIDDRDLRCASYKGLREIQDNAAVYELD